VWSFARPSIPLSSSPHNDDDNDDDGRNEKEAENETNNQTEADAVTS